MEILIIVSLVFAIVMVIFRKKKVEGVTPITLPAPNIVSTEPIDLMIAEIRSLKTELIKNRAQLEKIKWAVRWVGFVIVLAALGMFSI